LFIQQRRDHNIHVGEIERFLSERAVIPLNLDLSKPLESKMANIRLWKVQVAKTFNIRTPNDALLKVGTICDNLDGIVTFYCYSLYNAEIFALPLPMNWFYY